MKLFTTSASLDRALQPSPEMKDEVMAMEKIVGHNFKNKRLLEEALTHSSITYLPSYKRLAVLGDAALGLAMSKHLFLAYPNMDQGNFSKLRSANVSRVKFACAAVKHGFYGYLRHRSRALDNEVGEFAKAVSEWNEKYEMTLAYDGTIQPNHVLGDIVESVAAAIYIDLNFDLDKLWMNSAAALMILGLLQSDAMTNTKEAANSRIGYFPSVLYRLWVMIRWVTRLLVFCFKGISLLVIFFTVVKLVIG
ncbi:ribonuclease 3-like protein 2 [Pyrus ussuriensis x Pyrus communis]|uniref:Ribonuclease 3-like protein 2 n=1 Tax=Pyrus ussuriensis x Pyrus communis TaxID=2448454 RepID=A0A5N5FWM2_9ROSA|nr:ribonuclease 3-like protein 2 [Pyrus ussuriensis x Pyrus communis]